MLKRNPVERLYFKYNAAINKSQCLVEGCSTNLVGKHAANLERHIQKIHPEQYELLAVEKKSQTSSKVSKTTRQSTLDGIVEVRKKVYNVDIDKQTLIDGCIMLVTDNGRPLSILSDSGLRTIIDPIIKAIGSNSAMEKKCSIQQLTEEKEIQKKGAICLQNCTYSIVHEVAMTMGMHIVKPEESWDLWWCNTPMDFKKAKTLKKYQKTNHFLGMSEICRKDSLARNLNTMSNSFREDYNFYPMTWYLPSDYIKFQAYMNQHKSAAYILKPTTGSRGTGIYLTKSPKKINQYEHMICQLYISKPLLLDGYKFDMRVYTLIASCDPLKIYVYNDGLVRLATEPYATPTHNNVNDRFMHLTNYSVNKCNKMYIDNELFGSKRRITALADWLRSEGYDVKKIWNEIDDVIIKTMILAYPFVNRSYQSCFSGHKYTPPCFEILGFDILLDENCKPYLLEVNHSPDFHTDTSTDKIVKRELLIDTFKLLQLNKTLKKFVSGEDKWKIQQQTIKADKNVYKQRMLRCKEHFEQQNNIWQSKNMGNYRLVFSEKNAHLYEHFYYCNESAIYRHTCRTSLHQESEK